MMKPGDVCPSCSDYWKAQHKAQHRLAALPGSTMNKKLIVLACDYCDGEPIFTIGNKNESTG